MKKRSEIALRTTAPAQDERRLLGELDRALEALKQTIDAKHCFGADEATALIDALLAPDPAQPKPKPKPKPKSK